MSLCTLLLNLGVVLGPVTLPGIGITELKDLLSVLEEFANVKQKVLISRDKNLDRRYKILCFICSVL